MNMHRRIPFKAALWGEVWIPVHESTDAQLAPFQPGRPVLRVTLDDGLPPNVYKCMRMHAHDPSTRRGKYKSLQS